MHGKRTLWVFTAVILTLALLLLASCGGTGPSSDPVSGTDTRKPDTQKPDTTGPDTSETDTQAPDTEQTETTGRTAEQAGYEIPPYRTAEFHPDQAHGEGEALIDVSHMSEGYVAVSARSDSRLKFQVRCGDKTYNYNISSEGEPSVFPLQCGNAEYTFRVMENTTESRYIELYSETCEVVLASEFEPFIRPSDYVPYTEDSDCFRRARNMASTAASPLDYVKKVYEFICYSVNYDRNKATTVSKSYMSDPDATLYSGKGICFDYAVLAAAMLRSQGIPTKVVFGYVSPGDLYHAWNMFYTEETGWITVSYQVSGSEWTRLDLTFSANGADSEFIGDGSNYSDLYYY